ncbi:MAG: hypothetical protein QXH03_07920 [Candidatus Bathyarchaeia archaeon]
MKKTTLIIVIVCTLLLCQISPVLANNDSKEIEKIEIVGNVKKIYYKDGSMEMFVTCTVNLDFCSGVAYGISTPTPLIPLDKIFQVLKQIIENIFGRAGLGCFLLA